MMWGAGWYGMIFGPIFMILVAVAILIVRSVGGPWHGTVPPHYPPPSRTPLDIRKERLPEARATRTSLRIAAEFLENKAVKWTRR